MVVDTTHCLVAGAILLGKEVLNTVSWTGGTDTPRTTWEPFGYKKVVYIKNVKKKLIK